MTSTKLVTNAKNENEENNILKVLREMTENYELFVNRREVTCIPHKLHKIKAPLVPFHDFPSRVSVVDNEIIKPESGRDELEKCKISPTVPEKPPITFWRRADHSDVDEVTRLIERSDFIMNDLFGEPDVPQLIDKAIFSMVQLNSKEEIVSFICAFSFPDIPAVPSFEWYHWLENSYRLKDVTTRNCFFIHYMIWEKRYYHEFLKLSLETMFLEFRFLNYIIISKPPKVKIPNIIVENFVQVLPKDAKMFDCDSDSLQTLWLCLRHSLVERHKIRLAMVEDHDDLMPIIEQHTERLKELYGEYCMAEIIEYPGTKDRKTLVCESRGYAVGFMIVNKAVDLELLNSQFDLGVFHGLKKPHDQDEIGGDMSYEEEEEEEPIYFPDKVDPYLNVVNSDNMLKFLNWKPSLCVSKEELSSDSTSSDEPQKGYNELTRSMSDLIRETLNVELVSKFSAHSLSGSTSLLSYGVFVYPEYFSSTSRKGTVRSTPSLISLQHYNLPIYKGAPNAFIIEFHAMHPNFDERLSHELLEAAFEIFPDLKYCLMTVPSQAPSFPLLDFFTRVTPRPLKRFKQELYVCHKSSILVTNMRVRKIAKPDLADVHQLLEGIENFEFIYCDIASSCFYEDSAYEGFVLICSRCVVGVAVLCHENEMEYLTHHYRVSDFIDFDLHKIESHAILKHLVLSPVYQPHARFFLRDVMRKANVTSLYRTIYEENEVNWNTASLITVMDQLIPVKPRRMVKYHEPSLGPNVPPMVFRQKEIPFSLCHLNLRVSGLKKFPSNINVVIVGASRTAFAFLEALIFAPSSAYVIYNNITMVSPHGWGTELPHHHARDLMFPHKGKFNRRYKIQLCLKTYVHFVWGVMTEINRVEKYIKINNDSILSYDYLMLFCGRQYVMPIPSTSTENVRSCWRNYRPRCSLFKYLVPKQSNEDVNTTYPSNAFLINTKVDATNALISLQYLLQKRKGFPEDEKIIIYGSHIAAYLCLQALLTFGIPAHMIVFIEPFPRGVHSMTCFKDSRIDKAVLKSIQDLEISHLQKFVLFDWSLCNNQIQTVTFHSDCRKVTFKCLAMFPYEQKKVSDVTFKAVNEASLVYDGRLVINSSFQTNDPYIYAAGSMTKYQRKYYAQKKEHQDYSSAEVGKYVAQIIRKKIDPTEQETEDKPPELAPVMTKPLMFYGELPGKWKYFYIVKPGKFEDFESRGTRREYGDVLITGDCEMTKGYGYFKLLLDDYGFVEGIFCYTKDEIDIENLEMLYGKHEKLLNDLLMRFTLGMITNFYAYFREPWVYAIYHDQFKSVLEKNNELFYREKCLANRERIIEMVERLLNENGWKSLEKVKMEEINTRYKEVEIKEYIVDNLLSFLYNFEEPFPMYATPRIVRRLLSNSNTSPLHKTTLDAPAVRPSIRISEIVRKV